MADPDTLPEPPEPPRIRQLRQLVTVLTLTLTVGMIVMVGLFVWRLGGGPATPRVPVLPAEIPLPAGETLTGYAQNPDWVVLITSDEAGTQRLHLLRPGSSEIHQTTRIER